MPAKVWTQKEILFVRKHYPLSGSAWVAEKLGKTQMQVKALASRLKLLRENYKMKPDSALFIEHNINKLSYKEISLITGECIQRIKTFVYKRKLSPKTYEHYTTEEDEFIINNYKRLSNTEISDILGRSADSVKDRMRYRLKLSRSSDELKLIYDRVQSKTRFKKGNIPQNTKFDGYTSIRFDSHDKPYHYIRLGKGKFELLHRYNWMQKFGPIPEDKILRARDGDTLNTDPDNWYLIDRKINLELNSGRSELTDNYISYILSPRDRELRNSILETTPELIDLKRTEIKLRREINAIK